MPTDEQARLTLSFWAAYIELINQNGEYSPRIQPMTLVNGGK
jgi:hypothetical protein